MQPAKKHLKVLNIEDSEDDLALILHALTKGGFDTSYKRVDTAVELQKALQEESWDIILSDYNLPGFDGTAALKILQSTGLDIPFIVVSGAIGEETAVGVMRVGAHDFIMKDSLARLVPAIERELREVKVRQAKMRADKDLQLAAQVFESSVEGIMITDADSRILRINGAFTEITGYNEEEVSGRTPAILQSGRHDREFFEKLWQSIQEQGYWQGEIWNRRKNGEIYPEWLTISLVKDTNGNVTHYVGGFTDLSKQKQAEERIHHLTHYDALTELPNRMLFRARFKQPMLSALRKNKRVALLHLDIDRFITINDTLGHRAGDRLLQQVGRRLAATIHDRDIVARLGGDEFAIACPDLELDVDISAIAQSVMNAFSEPFWVDGDEVFMTPSVGVSIYPDDSDNYDGLVKCADTAMHHAKGTGGTYQFYHMSMNIDAADRLNMENALRRALDRQEFVLYYQPQVEIGSGRIIGVEALLRWRRGGDSMVLPDQFIPLLEQTGLIISVGEWALRSACYEIRSWQQAGVAENLPVAVNLSPTQFRHKELVGIVRAVLEETGVSPQMLELEITEGSVMEDPESALMTLNELHQMGVSIAIDDFGTGYSSLSYLKLFPIDVLKIDRSFVADISNDQENAVIVDTIIAMAHRLNLKVIAEGIEDTIQQDYLKEQGCDHGQGYLFGKPMPSSEIIQLLTQDAMVLESQSI